MQLIFYVLSRALFTSVYGCFERITNIIICPFFYTQLNLFAATCIVLIILISSSADSNQANAITQFYFAIPTVITDLKEITFSVDINDDNNFHSVSWTYNGSSFIPNHGTKDHEPNYKNLHLHDNNFLLAIDENIDPGTRLYMCVNIPYPLEQYECQWDAVDKENTGYAEFDFFFQSHKD